MNLPNAYYRFQLQEDRKLLIEAAIVRVMKKTQRINHNNLIMEVGLIAVRLTHNPPISGDH